MDASTENLFVAKLLECICGVNRVFVDDRVTGRGSGDTGDSGISGLGTRVSRDPRMDSGDSGLGSDLGSQVRVR